MNLYRTTVFNFNTSDESELLDGLMFNDQPTINDKCVYKVEMNDDKVLTNYHLNYFYSRELLLDILRPQVRCTADLDRVYDIVVNESHVELNDYFHINALYPHHAYILLETQRLRGCIAQRLGFRAVECGTSVLIVKSTTYKV